MRYVSYGDEGYGFLAGVELGSAGMDWPASIPFSPTIDDLADVVTAANDDPHIQIPRVKIGHYSEVNGELKVVDPFEALGDAAPAFGAVKNLRTDNDGAVILGDFVEVPVWLADAMPSAYRARSGEWKWDVETPGGKTYRLVMTAMSLLGLKLPAIQDLEDLERLLTDGPDIEAAVAAAATPPRQEASVPASDQTDTSVSLDVIRRRANQDWAMGDDRLFEVDGETVDPYWWWARDIRVDPNEIVMDDCEGGLWLLSFDTDGEDEVTFGAPVRVREVFVPVNASADDTTVVKTALPKAGQRVLASNLERPEKKAPSTAASRPDTTTTTEETSMDIDIAALRERTGLTAEQLPDDATPEQIIEAQAAAIEANGDNPEGEPNGTPEGEPAAAEPEAEPVAASTVTVDKATFDEVKTQAAEGAKVAKEIRAKEEQDALASAIGEGRISRSRREHYEHAFTVDRDGTMTLLTASEEDGGLAKGLAMPVDEIGGSDNEDSNVVATGEDGLLPESHSLLNQAERARLAAR